MNKDKTKIDWIIATWFGSGLLPKAPGTWGSLIAIPFAFILYLYTGPYGLMSGTVALFFIGVWASNNAERNAQRKDPGFIVVDEVVGQWIALFPLSFSFIFNNHDSLNFIFASISSVAFISFRIFDIWKPWPIRNIDTSIPGGLGIMLDDVIAGAYALIITTLFTVTVFWIIVLIS
ncbi:MAG: phosphatidylglycerophosphatase A [Candidatus Scalindua sp.]|nr:phosphatidylglycerophosphatase A [Candidatus Scalindua sp.]